MGHVAETTGAELQRELDAIDENERTKQLVAAIAYENCITHAELPN